VITVVAAAIVGGEPPRVLAAERAYPTKLAGWWELPGGKVDDGEDDVAALRRECREELGVDIDVGERVGADTSIAEGSAVLKVWWARLVEGEPQPLDHASLRWLTAEQLDEVPWLPADLPVVEAIRIGLTSSRDHG
jgi:8-oxo-dGTP diphosphatase